MYMICIWFGHPGAKSDISGWSNWALWCVRWSRSFWTFSFLSISYLTWFPKLEMRMLRRRCEKSTRIVAGPDLYCMLVRWFEKEASLRRLHTNCLDTRQTPRNILPSAASVVQVCRFCCQNKPKFATKCMTCSCLEPDYHLKTWCGMLTLCPVSGAIVATFSHNQPTLGKGQAHLPEAVFTIFAVKSYVLVNVLIPVLVAFGRCIFSLECFWAQTESS